LGCSRPSGRGIFIDAIYFGGYQTEARLIVRQATDQGLKAQFIGADAP